MMLIPGWPTPAGIADGLFIALTVWILLNGLDDLLVDFCGILASLHARRSSQPARRELLQKAERRIAVYIPCWRESGVIADMVARNRERVAYGRYDFFIGVYPNDDATVSAVRLLTQRFANVHLALCPHPGPTSKADCLNWIFQQMCLHEQYHAYRFDVVVTHDAEDVMHADGLRWINWYADEYDMVQIPVLPVPTPFWYFTHAVYCDEFSEYQFRDMPAREWMGAFIPSNGVGTGFRREALEDLAAAEGNRIFDPSSLTEDYENGFRLRLRGARQKFVRAGARTVATREYFPVTVKTATRQRTRWITGIALQTWDRHGWRGSLADRWWLWRDRKGLFGNPTSLLTNLLFVCGLLAPNSFRTLIAQHSDLLAWTGLNMVYRVSVRTWCVGRNFGWQIAMFAPLRIVLANYINSVASISALARFVQAKMQKEHLTWLKTEHYFPSGGFAFDGYQPLGEILVKNGYLTTQDLESALKTCPPGRRLGEHLRDLGQLSEDDLYEALSIQSRLPRVDPEPTSVRREVVRILPAKVIHDSRAMPFHVEDGKLLVAVSEIPGTELQGALQRFTRLEIRFHLVSSTRFERLTQTLV